MTFAIVALMAACGSPSPSNVVLPPIADAGEAAPATLDDQIVVVAPTATVTPDVAAKADTLSKDCQQAWQAYEQAQFAVNMIVDGPQALAVKRDGTTKASAAISQGAQAGVALVNYIAEHPEAVNIARSQVPQQTTWPTSFYDCFGQPPTNAAPASSPTGSSANSASTASTSPQVAGPSVSN